MSQLFSKTKREAPSDEFSKNAQLLIRAGYIYKEMAGVYAYLPLGLRVLNNIITVIREEMNRVGSLELSLTALQSKEVWEKSGRWDDKAVDIWFKTALQSGTELGLGFTHEEPLTRLMAQYVESYRDLPFSAYQFQTKFRNETRAKSGIMRTREFIMKDMYSFCRTVEEHETFYERARDAYLNVFRRVGIGEKTYYTFASGGSFSKFSHEFQTETDAGEDIIYVDDERKIAVNEEVYTDEVMEILGLSKDTLRQVKTSEVGNIFGLGTRFSEAFGLNYRDEEGVTHPVVMGSYGIGPGRLMGVITELLSDEKGLVWPIAIAPFPVHVVSLSTDETVAGVVNDLLGQLTSNGIDYLYDDRQSSSAGEKFADADMIGIPIRLVVSSKSLASGGVACKLRTTSEELILPVSEVADHVTSLIMNSKNF